uniref:Ubiquitin carboxyl-terminal hydrolase n=1 Tax=Macrostomum lignano TaxID=282301 RepID=A0A1I8IVI2_9PLAT
MKERTADLQWGVDRLKAVMDKQPALIMSEQDEQEQKLHQDEQEQEPQQQQEKLELQKQSEESITVEQIEQPKDIAGSSSGESTNASYIDSAGTDSSDIYHVKWIRHAGKQHPVVTQNINGPCPLLAIANILLLRGTISLPSGCDYVASQDLMQRLGDALLDIVTRQQQSNAGNKDEQNNLEQLVGDSLSLFPRLQTGLDINIGFSGYSKFEYTPELDIFDRFNIELVHGWVLDPQQCDVAQFIEQLTYNQLVEKIITAKNGEDQELLAQAIAAEEFLNCSSNQLTVFGLWQLTESLKEGSLCVLFRNNHFSTLTKHQGQLYLLVTDQGYLHQPDVVWETLNNIDNDSTFMNADFRRVSGAGIKA